MRNRDGTEAGEVGVETGAVEDGDPQLPPAEPAPELRTIYVCAELAVENVSEEVDGDIAGVYAIEVSRRLPDNLAASAALDGFHDTVPVACLDDFAFVVHDEIGAVLVECEDHEPYSGKHHARSVTRVDSPPWEKEPK